MDKVRDGRSQNSKPPHSTNVEGINHSKYLASAISILLVFKDKDKR